ncbi:MAG TPA: LuxR C-terminal-related transcriptional regulator, partial [Negativicutes bacterium]|nr:LuxR C-terminal-related transcriptional regulator [Negativicutes bacterium]
TRYALNQSLQGIWQHPLTVAQAPMGYGKTTAVREFLANSQARVLWQTVFDSSAAAFWSGFSRLLGGLDPVCGRSLAALGVPGDSLLREEAVELIGAVKFPVPTAIVIDDYHLLSSAAIDRFFERLIQADIPGLHIVIASRSRFGENTAELALKGHCLLLDKRHFELTAGEIDEYCKERGVRLKPEEAAFLHAYTEGWISAVYLCVLDYRQTGRLEQQPASLNELMDKVVYQPRSAEMKEFLTAICIFDSFTLAQAGHMWRQGNAADLLARLTSENAFIAFDHASQSYSLHNILSGFLRRIFDRQDTETRRAAWRLAGEWYISAGDYNHAMDYFYQAADFEKLLAAIETAGFYTFARQPKEARRAYFRDCPSDIRARHPGAGLAFAYDLLVANEPALFADQCREVSGHIDAAPGLDGRGRRQLRATLEIHKGYAAYNDLDATVGHYKAAWELLKGPAELIDTSGSATMGSPSVLYLYYRESGRLATTVRTLVAEAPSYFRLTRGHGAGVEYVMEAERHYYRGDFDNAEIVAHKALHIAKARRQPSVILCADFLRIRLALLRDEWAFVQDSLRRAREMIKQQATFTYMHTLDMCEGFVFACLNRGERIPAWIATGELPDTLHVPCHAFCHMLRAKALLIAGRHRELAGIADQLAAAAGFFPNLLALIYIRICEAAALDRLGRRQDALAALQNALDVAAPDGVVMPFVENGEYIADLLAALPVAGPQQDFIAGIRELYPPVAEKWRAIAAELSGPGGRARLTEREAAVAELVAAGLSDQAVGKTLHIAEVTAKKALHSAYRKLGVSNRAALTRVLLEHKIE